MVTFSINENRSLQFDSYANELWGIIKRNRGYFQKFNGDRADEAMSETWTHMLEHRDSMYENPIPYMKKLARSVLHGKSTEIPVSVFSSEEDSENGDDSYIFDSLAEINEGVTKLDRSADKETIGSRLAVLYLEDPNSFEKLRNLTESLTGIKDKNLFPDKNGKWFRSFNALLKAYPASLVRECLCDFFRYLAKEQQVQRFKKGIRVMDFTPNYGVVELMSTTGEHLLDESGIEYRGKKYSLNPRTLSMTSNIDIDHVSWKAISGRDIIKISLDDIMDAIIDDIMVEEGVNTPLIRWCKSYYIMESLSGTCSYVNADRNLFVDFCRQEVIFNIVSAIKNVVAVSDHYIYATPMRKLVFDTIEFVSKQGRKYRLKLELR